MAQTETLPTFLFDDGRQLVSQKRIPGESASPFDKMTAVELRDYVGTLWRDAFEAKRAEIERLKTCSLYYDGFHYTNSWQNRTNPIANYCFSVVETVVPALTEVRPRPEIVPRRAGMNQDFINKLAEAGNWLMDVGKFDISTWLGARDKSIYGWNCWIISIDYRTGMPYVKNLSVFDVYWDPSARNEDEAEYFFIGTPVSTAKLQATYPKVAKYIRPDGIASPAYDVTVRPWQDYLDDSHRYEHPNMVSGALLFHKEADAAPAGSTSLVASTGEWRAEGRTTFLLQLLHHDDAMQTWVYIGDEKSADGTVSPGMHHKHEEPCCRSGWRLITMTAEGLILDNKPLEDCFGGIPLVFDFDYRRTDRFPALGEVDNVIPLQRRNNRRDALINRAVELSMNPPVVTNRDSGLPADKGTVAAGEMLRISRGSELRYLDFKVPLDALLNLQLHDARVMDTVSGVQDVQQGIRPAGIEAAAAIRRLQEAAQVRVRGKEAQAHDARSRLVKKLMVCAGKKLQGNLGFKGSAGAFVNLNPEDLLDEFDIRFAQSSGTTYGRQAMEEKAVALYDRQAIDEIELLEAFDWKNREEVAKRMEVRRLQQEMIAAQAAVQTGGNGAGKKGGRPAAAAGRR